MQTDCGAPKVKSVAWCLKLGWTTANIVKSQEEPTHSLWGDFCPSPVNESCNSRSAECMLVSKKLCACSLGLVESSIHMPVGECGPSPPLP